MAVDEKMTTSVLLSRKAFLSHDMLADKQIYIRLDAKKNLVFLILAKDVFLGNYCVYIPGLIQGDFRAKAFNAATV